MDDDKMNEEERPCSRPIPGNAPDPGPDPEWEEYITWRDREIAAGRDDPVPPEGWELEAPVVSVSLGDAAGIDPVLLAAMCGPDGLGGESLGPQFAQDQAADVLRPGPVLAALTEQAAADPGRLSDDELIGVLRASRRLEAREAFKQAVVMAEFARRREAQFTAATRRGVAAGCRPGAFPGEELAAELVTSRGEASRRIDAATDLTARLPATFAGMAAGLIDADRASVISFYTRSLAPADAARAEKDLAAAAPRLRVEQLARRAAALEMKLAPEAVRARKEHARQTRQRVEVRREDSGNASLSGREMDTAGALASKAYIDAVATRLRAAGLAGPIGTLRVLALTDLTQGRDPLDRVSPASPEAEPVPDPDPAVYDNGHADNTGHTEPADRMPGDRRADGREPAQDAPLSPTVPALINIIVPAGTLLGWSTAPAQAGTWGLLDADETRAIISAAARHPRTRWSFTLTGRGGTAIAHGYATGRRPPPDLTNLINATGPPGSLKDTSATTRAALITDLIHRLNPAFRSIARSTCDHARAENRYTPSRKLADLIRARTTTCTAPGCTVSAASCDLDHTTPHPRGPTCQCNLGFLCRTHHRAKQAPDWKLRQPAPGVFRWIMPSGRTHNSTPATYDIL